MQSLRLSFGSNQQFWNLLGDNKQAFSLNGEVGQCNYEIKLDLIDETPFFIRPYTVSEQDKLIIDKELTKLVKMGVLKQGVASSSSPVMLINKKGSNTKRVVSDLRYLNTKLRKQHWPFPLVKDTIQKIGMSSCTVVSTIDLKDAFHSLKLHRDTQRHAGITSFYGGKSYYYTRLPKGASLSPSEFQMFIERVLDTLPGSRDFCIAHMDDLIIFSRDTQQHMRHLNSILGVITSNRLKLSPKKAQFFRNHLEYMGHIISIREGKPHLEPMLSNCEAIRRLKAPSSAKELCSFIGGVNYLSIFLPRLQELLLPMHKLSRKDKSFKWTNECQTRFEEIKTLLVKPPVLAMPSHHGDLRLYSDTSRHATGATLCQVVDGKEVILGYHSKTLPSAAQ